METITDTDDADYLALLPNIPAQAECLLHCLKEAASVIGFYVNSEKYVFKTRWCYLHIKQIYEISRPFHIP